MFKIGDKVSVIDDLINGKVIEINQNKITIKTEDDFVMTFLVHELVKINDFNDLKLAIKTIETSTILKDKEQSESKISTKKYKEKKETPAIEFDLHIEKLVKNKQRLTNYDILTLQVETAKRQLEFAIAKRIPKLVFIHGVGEGILKAELDFLFGHYNNIIFHDANYQKYGQGATEVLIKYN